VTAVVGRRVQVQLPCRPPVRTTRIVQGGDRARTPTSNSKVGWSPTSFGDATGELVHALETDPNPSAAPAGVGRTRWRRSRHRWGRTVSTWNQCHRRHTRLRSGAMVAHLGFCAMPSRRRTPSSRPRAGRTTAGCTAWRPRLLSPGEPIRRPRRRPSRVAPRCAPGRPRERCGVGPRWRVGIDATVPDGSLGGLGLARFWHSGGDQDGFPVWPGTRSGGRTRLARSLHRNVALWRHSFGTPCTRPNLARRDRGRCVRLRRVVFVRLRSGRLGRKRWSYGSFRRQRRRAVR